MSDFILSSFLILLNILYSLFLFYFLRKSIKIKKLGSTLVSSLLFLLFVQISSLYMFFMKSGDYLVLSNNENWRIQFAYSTVLFQIALLLASMPYSSQFNVNPIMKRLKRPILGSKISLTTLIFLYLILASITLVFFPVSLLSFDNLLVLASVRKYIIGSSFVLNQLIRIALPFISILIIYVIHSRPYYLLKSRFLAKRFSYLFLLFPLIISFATGQRSSIVFVLAPAVLFLSPRLSNIRIFLLSTLSAVIVLFALMSVFLSRIIVNESIPIYISIANEVFNRIFFSQGVTTAAMYQLFDTNTFSLDFMTLNTLDTYFKYSVSNSSMLFSLIHPEKTGSASYSPVADFFYDAWYFGPIFLGIIYGRICALLDYFEKLIFGIPVYEIIVIITSLLVGYSLLGGGLFSLPYQGLITLFFMPCLISFISYILQFIGILPIRTID